MYNTTCICILQQRSLYRILCIVHKARMTNRPRYISDMISPSKISRNLRSNADKFMLFTPHCRLSRTLNRAFMHSAPKNWNKIPLRLRKIPLHNTFNSNLKDYILNMY